METTLERNLWPAFFSFNFSLSVCPPSFWPVRQPARYLIGPSVKFLGNLFPLTVIRIDEGLMCFMSSMKKKGTELNTKRGRKSVFFGTLIWCPDEMLYHQVICLFSCFHLFSFLFFVFFAFCCTGNLKRNSWKKKTSKVLLNFTAFI